VIIRFEPPELPSGDRVRALFEALVRMKHFPFHEKADRSSPSWVTG